MVFTLRLTMTLTDVCDLYYFLYFFKKPTSGYSFAKNADPFSAKFDVCDQSKGVLPKQVNEVCMQEMYSHEEEQQKIQALHNRTK